MTPRDVTNRPAELRNAARIGGLTVYGATRKESKWIGGMLWCAKCLFVAALVAATVYAWPEPHKGATTQVWAETEIGR